MTVSALNSEGIEQIMTERTFQVAKAQINLQKWAMLTLIVVVGLLFYADKCLVAWLIVPSIVFGGYRYYMLSRLIVSIDNDGIWQTRLGKANGLIAWQEISALENLENKSMFRDSVYLLDRQAKRCLRVHRDLENYADLCQMIVSKIAPVNSPPQHFSKPIRHHLLVGVMLLFCLLLSGISEYFLSDISPNRFVIHLCLWGLFAVIINRYLITVYQVRIEGDVIHFYYPFRQKTVAKTAIKHVDLSALTIVVTLEKQTIRLYTLGDNPVPLFQALRVVYSTMQ